MKNIKYILIVFIGAASYGILATFVKIGYSFGFSVGEITGSQMFIGMVCLWIIALLAGIGRKQHKVSLNLKQVITLMGVGSLTGLTGILYYSSLSYIPASLAIVLLFQFTWIGILIDWVIEKRKPTQKTWLILSIIFAGTLLSANVFANTSGIWHLHGILLGLASACSYSFFIFASGKVEAQLSPWNRSAIMITGAVVLTFLVFPPTFFTSSAFGEGLWWIALILALFGAVFPTLCFTYGVPHTGVGLASVVSAIELPVAVFLAWIVLQEAVVWYQWVGVLLIILAIILNRYAEIIDNKRGRMITLRK